MADPNTLNYSRSPARRFSLGRVGLSIFVLMLSHGLPARAQTLPIEVNPDNVFATPVYVFKPKGLGLPPDGAEVKVTIRATINASGKVENPVFEESPENEQYIAHLKPAVTKWIFRPAIKDCKGATSEQVFTVWLANEKGFAKMAVSKPTPAQALRQSAHQANDAQNASVAAPLPLPRRPRFEWEDHPAVRYPREARVVRADGEAEYIALVNTSGEIVSGHVLYALPFDSFGTAAKSAFARARFKPWASTEGGTSTVCVVMPLIFCLEGDSKAYANPKCNR